MTYGESGSRGGIGNPDDAQQAFDYIDRHPGLAAQTHEASCLKEISTYTPPGVDAAPVLGVTVNVEQGFIEISGGKRPGSYGRTERQCGRMACNYTCQVVVTSGGKVERIDNKNAYSFHPEKWVCAADI